ncbi:hypothetical protein ADUPG1_009988 [Aduncisulcus paluster]|uniref:Uncharacterized protein n=1 Tax=Aduncisulcus paluster TaxID=2918883 RepID=A0ABQ5KXH1_9EUKA|nr:hypothetical protein ADUPG1_009988 [Aduncisulcus paluster]
MFLMREDEQHTILEVSQSIFDNFVHFWLLLGVIRSQTWHSTPLSAHYIRYSFNNLFVFLSDNQTKIVGSQ